jgi:ribonuclease VapC
VIAVDTSAIVAILWDEPESKRFRARLGAEDGAVISAGNVLELELVLARTQASGGSDVLEAMFDAYRIAVRPFDLEQLALARDAGIRYGKGRHRAALNFGDCFAYALARSEGLALLCKGNDFALTDIAVA